MWTCLKRFEVGFHCPSLRTATRPLMCLCNWWQIYHVSSQRHGTVQSCPAGMRLHAAVVSLYCIEVGEASLMSPVDNVTSVTAAYNWMTQSTSTSCTTEMKMQTTYMMLSRCVTPSTISERQFSRHVRHFSSLYSVHHAAFGVFDNAPSIRHEIQDQAEAYLPVFDTSQMTLMAT